MAVTLEELTEYAWEDFLTEEMYEEALESYAEQLTNLIPDIEDTAVTEEMEETASKNTKLQFSQRKILRKHTPMLS